MGSILSGGCSGVFRGVPRVFWGCSGDVPGCSGSLLGRSGPVPCFADTPFYWLKFLKYISSGQNGFNRRYSVMLY